MPKNKSIPHLIAYDIGNPKRLVKIHRFLKQRAIPLQYSVFYMKLNSRQREVLIEQLDDQIIDAEDDIRIYPLPSKPSWTSFGKSMWPSLLFGDEGLPNSSHRLR